MYIIDFTQLLAAPLDNAVDGTSLYGTPSTSAPLGPKSRTAKSRGDGASGGRISTSQYRKTLTLSKPGKINHRRGICQQVPET